MAENEEDFVPPRPLLTTVIKQWNDHEGFGFMIKSTPAGVFVGTVRPGGPGDRAGLKLGQKIFEVNGDVVVNHQDAVGKIRACKDRFQMLVAEPRAFEFYEKQGVVLSSVMSDVEMRESGSKPYTWNDVFPLLERTISAYIAKATPTKKYMAEAALRLPLMYFIHMWFLLSPTSDYTVVDIVLCLLRYIGGVFIFGCWGLSVKKLLIIYRCLAAEMFTAFLLEKVYWTFQNEAMGACHDVWLPWKEDTWWIPVTVTFALQVSRLKELFEKHNVIGELRLIVGLCFIPYIFCSLGLFVYYIAPVHYWLSKILFWFCILIDLTLFFEDAMYNNQNGKFEFPPMPGPFFVRDLFALFGVVYYMCCSMFDLMFMYSAFHVFSLSYLSSTLGMWCTSFVIVSALGAILAIIANSAAAVYLKIIKGEWNFAALMNSPLGSRINVTMTTYCIEAGILSLSDEKRILNMESVLFVVTWVIFLQAWDLTESHLLAVINSGESNRWLNTARVLLASLVLLTVPTLLTVHVAPKIGVDTWLMMNVTGNIIMLTRATMVFVEIGLVACTWYVDEGLGKLEDVIYFSRIIKTGATVICALGIAYYRFYAPFFDAWWVTRFIVVLSDVSIVTFNLCKREWVTFQMRRQRVGRVTGLPDATAEEIADQNNDCSICFSEMTNAKKLPCSHIFHGLCLRKWFQVRLVCPYCNVNVFNGN